jgi:hypothetical protein
MLIHSVLMRGKQFFAGVSMIKGGNSSTSSASERERRTSLIHSVSGRKEGVLSICDVST